MVLQPNCDVFEGKPIVTYVLEGEGTDGTLVKPVRAVIGDTNPALAQEGTFRYLVWTALYRKNPKEGDMRVLAQRGEGIDNGVHCSDSVENGKREVNIFYR
jgi:nucleoside diphosphate kinase